jgi:hypothetical protein
MVTVNNATSSLPSRRGATILDFATRVAQHEIKYLTQDFYRKEVYLSSLFAIYCTFWVLLPWASTSFSRWNLFFVCKLQKTRRYKTVYYIPLRVQLQCVDHNLPMLVCCMKSMLLACTLFALRVFASL